MLVLSYALPLFKVWMNSNGILIQMKMSTHANSQTSNVFDQFQSTLPIKPHVVTSIQ